MHASLIVAFGAVLMIAVLLSDRANRTVLSTSVVFLVAGLCIGRGGLGWVDPTGETGMLKAFAELSLFAILFVDSSRLSIRELRTAWQLPGRALLVGMPFTIGAIALGAHWLLDVSWLEAFLLGAILSPTDPVFVAAILERQDVPLRLRRLLRVESGLNDGVALPVFIVLLAMAEHQAPHPLQAIGEAAFGIAVGVAVPLAFVLLERTPFFAAHSKYRPLAAVAIATVLFGLGRLLPLNEFLAAFAGGVTLASAQPDFAARAQTVGEPLAESLKLGTLLVFGAVLTLPGLLQTGWAGLAFVAATLLAARPIALVFAFIGSGLSRREWLAAAWFGPRGFASLLYALIMLEAGLANGPYLFAALALVIVLSIAVHSSTDVAVARAFRSEVARRGGGRAQTGGHDD